MLDIYTPTSEKLLGHFACQQWPELARQLQQAARRQPSDWRLPILACQAVGGEPTQALPAVMAIACLQTSIILVDDMLDDDPRGEYRFVGAGPAANQGVALQALALDLVAAADLPDSIRAQVMESLNRMALLTACGQYRDALEVIKDEEDYWTLIRAKSSPFFGTAMWVGALLGGASPAVAEGMQQIGCLHGEMVQIYDDLKDVLAVPASPDWFHGCKSLPLLYAESVPHPDRATFLELRSAVSDPDALTEAQKILVRSGAASYCIAALTDRHQQLSRLVQSIPLSDREELTAWLKSQLDPIRELFQSVGQAYPETA
jgi:geranylgeranyl diphosphate synthase type I